MKNEYKINDKKVDKVTGGRRRPRSLCRSGVEKEDDKETSDTTTKVRRVRRSLPKI